MNLNDEKGNFIAVQASPVILKILQINKAKIKIKCTHVIKPLRYENDSSVLSSKI